MLKLFAHSQKGQSVAFFVLLLPLLLIMPVLVLELGHLYIYKAELQHAADATAQAVANGLDKDNDNGIIMKLIAMNANRMPESFRNEMEVETRGENDGTPVSIGDPTETTTEDVRYEDKATSNPPPTYRSTEITDAEVEYVKDFIDTTPNSYWERRGWIDSSDIKNKVRKTTQTETTNGKKIETTTVISKQPVSFGSTAVVLSGVEIQPIFVGVFGKDPFQTIEVGSQSGTETGTGTRISTTVTTTTTPVSSMRKTTTRYYQYTFHIYGSDYELIPELTKVEYTRVTERTGEAVVETSPTTVVIERN